RVIGVTGDLDANGASVDGAGGGALGLGGAGMAIPYYPLDSFTSDLFAGQPGGVCILSAFLADSVMQKIAAENRHSDTAFVVPRADGDFDLRWFTPKIEDDLCGHATLASAYVLALRKHNV